MKKLGIWPIFIILNSMFVHIPVFGKVQLYFISAINALLEESNMNYLGVTYSIGAKPELDPGFIPFGVWIDRKSVV